MANGWATIGGSFVLYGLVYLGRIKDVIAPEGIYGWVVIALYCFAATWFVIFFGRLVYAPIALVKQRDRRITQLESEVAQSFTSANTAYKALAIEFEADGPCIRRTVYPSGNAQFQVFVRIKNVGNGFLTECVTSILSITPKPDGGEYTILSPTERLGKGEHTYIMVSRFNEVRGESGPAISNDLVAFAFATGSAWAGRFATLPPPDRANAAILTIEAKALECGPVERRFRLWVEPDRRLMMEPVG